MRYYMRKSSIGASVARAPGGVDAGVAEPCPAQPRRDHLRVLEEAGLAIEETCGKRTSCAIDREPLRPRWARFIPSSAPERGPRHLGAGTLITGEAEVGEALAEGGELDVAPAAA